MGIRKTIAAVLTAAMVLSMTACGNNDTFIANNGGAGTNSNGSSTGKVFGIEDDVPDPPKQVSMWDVLPEIPVTDASAFTYKYDSELGGMIVTDYLRESPKVRIPDKLEGEPVVSVAFSGVQKEITELVMPDSVNKFSLSPEIINTLQYVNVPNSVTTLPFDNDCGLRNCKKIQIAYYNGKTYDYEHIGWLYDAVNLGESGMLIENGVLKDVSRELTEVVIPNNVTAIARDAFDGCSNLSSVTIPDSVTSIGTRAFYDCTGLTSVVIPNSVTEIGDSAFYHCTGLTSVTIPDSVVEMGSGAFEFCVCLTSVNIPDSVTGIAGHIFDGCTGLKSIIIPNSVTKIDSCAFRGCTSLTSVIIPDSVTEIYDGGGWRYSAFDNCKNIQATYKGITYDYEHIGDLYKAINSN